MSKRRLSKQQQNRIEKRTLRSGDNKTMDVVSREDQLQQGTVVAHHGKRIDILTGELFSTADGHARRATVSSHLRANLPLLVCGDRVLWRQEEQAGEQIAVVEQLLERETLLSRPRPFTDPKPVASNIDLIILVIAAAPAPISSLIDRYLIAAEQIGVEIAIAINKVELLEDDTHKVQETCIELNELAELYQSLDYPIFAFSAKDLSFATNELIPTAKPLNELLKKMAHRTCILVGQSGVGKSSLLNAIAGQHQALVGDISESTSKGKHTTTNSTLYLLESSAAADPTSANFAVIDSPGIREFGLWHLTESDIINGMREFGDFALQCRFRDCDHDNSAGCAIRDAIDSKQIHPRRVASYRAILESLQDS